MLPIFIRRLEALKNKEVVESLKNTYCFFKQDYAIMDEKYNKTIGHYFKDKVIESHLDGKYALCVFAGPKATRFMTVDVDAGGKHAVRQVIDAFVKLGIPGDRIYVSMSGRKGYHVDIFFSPCIRNERARNLYDLMIWQTGLDPKKVEFLPTDKRPIKIPLGIHPQTGNRCWFLDRETLKPIERMEYINEIQPVDCATIYNVLKTWNKRRWNELYAEMVCEDTGRDTSIEKEIEFNEAYYERKRLTAPGTRHSTMITIATDLRHYGANSHQIKKALRGFYYRQDPAMITSSERKVLDDIDDIAEWAEESVPVVRYRRSPNEGTPRVISFNKYDINYILLGRTSATRKVALLLWSYCKMFGAAHLSYATIAETVGCKVATAETAVKSLIDGKIISRMSGGCHYVNGRLVRKSNTYFIPKDKIYGCPCDSDLVAESAEFSVIITKENFTSYYYGVLAAICRPEYLAKFLTKPEMEGVLACSVC